MRKAGSTAAAARWALQDAKNKFSKVVDAAIRGQPQVVTRRGVDTAVLIAYDQYERMLAARSDKRLPLSHYLLAGSSVGAPDAFKRIDIRSRDEV